MTRGETERVIRIWQRRLRLEHWRITLDWADRIREDENANAKMWRSAYYDDATLRVAPDWDKWDAAKCEQIVIHELLHLCHRGIDETWHDLDGQLHRDAWTIADRRYDQEMEGFVDRLAYCLLEIAKAA